MYQFYQSYFSTNPMALQSQEQATQENQVTDLVPIDIIRTETVLSKLPIHNLAKKGRVHIHITRNDEHGKATLKWKVSPNPEMGEPRQLAYKIDTLVVNRRIHELGRPLPKIIKLGSLRKIGEEIGHAPSLTKPITNAIKQNAGALIEAAIDFLGKDGKERHLEAVFTHYSVIFTGKKLPGGEKADAVYLILNDPYWEVLNSAPDRPLDYAYLKALTPAPQRFYELLSYRIFAAIKYKHKEARMLYSEYCTYAAQQRYVDYERVKKQMYKIHRPHVKFGYLERVAELSRHI